MLKIVKKKKVEMNTILSLSVQHKGKYVILDKSDDIVFID